MSIMIGIDPHRATHTAVAVDGNEQTLDEFTLGSSRVRVLGSVGRRRTARTTPARSRSRRCDPIGSPWWLPMIIPRYCVCW